MCGFAGFWDPAKKVANPEAVLKSMNDIIAHRGPDKYGYDCDVRNGLALGHRRLAIIDISENGSQPMTSHNGRYVIAYNGEIYNYQSIKKELDSIASIQYKGTSDTEVLLTAFEYWGIEATIRKAIGMFAMAIWDNKEQTLSLVRDRMGEKPLYYGIRNNTLFFGSNICSFDFIPGFKKEISTKALSLFFRYSYVPAPLSIYEEVYKSDPGSIITFKTTDINGQDAAIRQISSKKYWQLAEVINTTSRQNALSLEKETARLDTVLKEVISEQMIADVPLGVFLSGGIDSSMVAAIMQSGSQVPVNSFSIGFKDKAFNEAPYAKAVAQHLGTHHTELIVDPETALETLLKVTAYYDEPFGDSSQLPTYLVAALARKEVTVCLSGDGGDEVFAGYNKYHTAARLRKLNSRVPSYVRKVAKVALKNTATRNREVPGTSRTQTLVSKIYNTISINNDEDIYDFLSANKHYDVLRTAPAAPAESPFRQQAAVQVSIIEKMMYWDTLAYLSDDILVKVDRATMASSLESRAPFLDKRLVEFAWSLPLSYKLNDSESKIILKRLLNQYVPASLFERPKKGFSIPLKRWLLNDLKPLVSDYLSEGKLKQSPYLSEEKVSRLLREFYQHGVDHSATIWNLLIWQIWCEKNAASPATGSN